MALILKLLSEKKLQNSNEESSEKDMIITNEIKCKNIRCITSVEQELDHIFVLTDKDKKTYRCKYCESLNEN